MLWSQKDLCALYVLTPEHLRVATYISLYICKLILKQHSNQISNYQIINQYYSGIINQYSGIINQRSGITLNSEDPKIVLICIIHSKMRETGESGFSPPAVSQLP